MYNIIYAIIIYNKYVLDKNKKLSIKYLILQLDIQLIKKQELQFLLQWFCKNDISHSNGSWHNDSNLSLERPPLLTPLLHRSFTRQLQHEPAIAFLRLCILNSLFYAARNELEKIGGPPLNGVVTSERCCCAPTALETYRRAVTTRGSARDGRRVLRFASHVSDVRLEERALLSSTVSSCWNNAAHCPLSPGPWSGPSSHPARRDPPKIHLHSRAILISRTLPKLFFALFVPCFVIVNNMISKKNLSNYLRL